MTINTVIENQIVNHNTVNGKTNREIYNMSRVGNFEMYWFSFDGENDFKSTSFAKAKNYTVAHLDNWGSGEIDHWVKINNIWYYVTKEQLTNLFDPYYEETNEELDNYVEDNVIEDDNDPNVKMMADIIYFIKNGKPCDDLVLSNPAIGVDIRILKDWDFFDLMVSSEYGQHSYTDSYSVEIEDFTEVFDFIFGSIDKIVETTTCEA